MSRRRTAIVIGSAFLLGGGTLDAVTVLPPVWKSRATPEAVVDIPTRPGQEVRALVARPEAPTGSVVLLAGGHGNLDIRKDGSIGWGKVNQLVRTRLAYRDRGFAVIVPDIAGDLKVGAGARHEYRWSSDHARDLAAVLGYAAGIARPVYLVGTSRAALSVFNLASRPELTPQPDAIAVTSGMLINIDGAQPSVERNVRHLDRVRTPMLILFHRNDACPMTPSSSAQAFRPLVKNTAAYDIALLSGGTPSNHDPCLPQSEHGFLGLDHQVVETVVTWLQKWPAR